MLGPDLLAAPILEPGARSRQVYLPPAKYWEDWWTGERFPGGRRLEAQAPLDRLPLYVRSGAALPLTDPARNSAESEKLPLRWRAYPAGSVEGRLYLDDGLSTSYERGDYTLLRLRSEPGSAGRRITIEHEAGTLTPILGTHPGLSVELSGPPGRSEAVNVNRLPWEWTSGQ